MPKKHQPNYKPASNYVHPSLSSSRPSPSSHAASSSPQSVNDRLNQLRREQAPSSAIDRRNEITETLTTHVTHPAVRHILNLPEVAAPRPRVIARSTNGRRVPGPSAPQSWLERSRHAPQTQNLGDLPRLWKTLRPRFTERLPASRSLVHYTCKALAKNWGPLLEYEQYYLATLPIQLKDILLSYLAIYGPQDGITLETLRLLFLTEQELEDATGSDDLVHLDLTGMITKKLTVRDLDRYITQRVPAPKTDEISDALRDLWVSEPVADSWEEAEAEAPVLPKAMHNVRFPRLTHLSLGYPQRAQWDQLLALSSHLPTLTHSSLAFWPKPTMTPHATGVSMASQHVKVSLGGNNFYSELDNDWQEAANILRRLANNTYCLKWLDLCGCDWIPALTWGIDNDGLRLRSFPGSPRGDSGDWDIHHAPPCPDWNGSWGQVTHINISQGWMPHNVNAIRALPAGMLSCELLSYLRSERGQKMLESIPATEGQTAPQIRRWIEKESENRNIANNIQSLRKAAKGPYCEFDYGWTGIKDRRKGRSIWDDFLDP
ncbi:hypothetical protein MPH_07726 [Macrophomina phaseolina MS6]|uniref:Tafazzin n=1 Tax=Macrophomina phaseolina (strain MS6) TaxID=1126212 RepID=K2RK85_MACPH|nr:hypothetical protein MPH_07726 [Macrophomina phaseolina MS6]